MAEPDDFDAYYMWLGIPPEERPAHHYRLLDVKAFESNVEAIEMGFNRRMLYLRSIKDGARLDEAQQLQEELTEARVCLLNREKKAAYDAELRRRLAPQSTLPPPLPLPLPLPPAARMPPPIVPPPLPLPELMPPWSPYAQEPQPVHPRPQAPPVPPYALPPPLIDDAEITAEFRDVSASPQFGSQHEPFDQTVRNSRPSRDWAAASLPLPLPQVVGSPSPPSSFSFEGRASRQEFWESIGIVIAAALGILLVNLFAADTSASGTFAGLLVWIAAIITVWYSLAVQVRRWHDIGATGWCVLVLLIPWLGAGFALLALGLVSGSDGPNLYGDIPPDGGDRSESPRGGSGR